MNDEERFKRLEEDSKSTKEDVRKLNDLFNSNITQTSLAMVKLELNVTFILDSVKTLTAKIEEITKAPAKEYSVIKTTIITAGVTAAVTILVTLAIQKLFHIGG